MKRAWFVALLSGAAAMAVAAIASEGCGAGSGVLGVDGAHPPGDPPPPGLDDAGAPDAATPDGAVSRRRDAAPSEGGHRPRPEPDGGGHRPRRDAARDVAAPDAIRDATSTDPDGPTIPACPRGTASGNTCRTIGDVCAVTTDVGQWLCACRSGSGGDRTWRCVTN
jgi:hypothetical protein